MMIRIHWNNDCDEMINRLKGACRDIRADKDKLEIKLGETEAKLSIKHTTDMAREDRITKLLQEIQSLEERKDNVQTALMDRHSSEIKVLINRNHAIQQALSDLTDKHSSSTTRVRVLSKTKDEYETKIAVMDRRHSQLEADWKSKRDECNARGQRISQLQEEIREMKACISAGFTMTKSGLLAREYDQSMSMPVKPEQLKILNELITPVKVIRNRTTNKNKMRPRVEIMKEKIAQLEHWQKHGKRPYVKKNIAFWKGIQSTPTYHNIKYNGVKV
jgi:chromosome segregation ATPase